MTAVGEVQVRICNLSTVRQWQDDHSDAQNHIWAWYKIAKAAKWTSLADVRAEIPSADQVKCCLVFNIAGNKYRLIGSVAYAGDDFGGELFLHHFLTHAEDDKNRWQKDCD